MRAQERLGPVAWVGIWAALATTTAEAAPPKAPRKPAPAAAPAPPGGSAANPQKPAEKGPPGPSKANGAAEASPANVVATEEGKEGVKTYKFGAVEVESRLRSPQLIYFLRRVRAEFIGGDLGHRSFLRELSDTARQPTFR